MNTRVDDYNLSAACENNPQAGLNFDEVAEIIHCVEGEQDAAPWYWFLQLIDGTFAYASGGCDYTGWD